MNTKATLATLGVALALCAGATRAEDTNTCTAAVKDLRALVSPHETTVCGLKAGHMKNAFTTVLPGGQKVPSCGEQWIVRRGAELLVLGSLYPAPVGGIPSAEEKELKQIFDSLKIEK